MATGGMTGWVASGAAAQIMPPIGNTPPQTQDGRGGPDAGDGTLWNWEQSHSTSAGREVMHGRHNRPGLKPGPAQTGAVVEGRGSDSGQPFGALAEANAPKLIHRPGALNLWGPRYPSLTAGIPVPPQATADLSAMSTETLIDEMERLVKRVQDRDAKYYKRMRFPMGHSHPSQFWPMTSEVYKIGYFSVYLWARPSDYLHLLFWGAFWYMYQARKVRTQNPWNFWLLDSWQGGDNRYYTMPRAGLGPRHMFWITTTVEGTMRVYHVQARHYGLDENSYEIEKYGPMYPDEIALCARRKEKYEQEYIRIREGFQNYKETTDKIDRPITYFANTRAMPASPGGYQQSGYWNDEEASRVHEKLRAEAAERRREKTGYVE